MHLFDAEARGNPPFRKKYASIDTEAEGLSLLSNKKKASQFTAALQLGNMRPYKG
jgi:hypothetical protein